MKSITKLGLGLCIIFGSLLLALAAELYYLLWRKKNHQQTQTHQKKIQFFTHSPILQGPTSSSAVHEPQSKDLWLKKPFAEENMGSFPRFLFTIAEETREDLESEDGGFNLGDLLHIVIIREDMESEDGGFAAVLHAAADAVVWRGVGGG